MAHHIPKISYGTPVLTSIELPYPPEGFGEPEQDDAQEKILTSLSGRRQISVDYIRSTLNVKFQGLDDAKLAALRTFFRGWAGLGNSFRYYHDKDGADFTTYELGSFAFKPKRTGINGENAFHNELPMTFTRVADEEVLEYMETEILNNQASAVDLDGITLDASLYTSLKIFFEIRRTTDLSEIVCNGFLTAVYRLDTNTWEITEKGTYDGDEHGCEFSMDGSQIQYTSDLLSGTNYSGTMKIKNLTI